MKFDRDYHYGIHGCVSITSECEDEELARAIRESDYIANETRNRCDALTSYEGKSRKWKLLLYEAFQRRVCQEAGLPAPHQTGWKEPTGIWAAEPKHIQARKAIEALNLPAGTNHQHIRRMYKYFDIVGYKPRMNCKYTGSKLTTGTGYTLMKLH